MSRRLNIDHVLLNRFLEGRISFTDLGRPEKRAAILELQRRGVTPDQASRLYRITVDAYQRRITHTSTPLPMPRRNSPPPGEPQCVGQPELFELKADGWPHQEALNLCAKCTVVEWCLRTVQPRSSGFSGVAGGKAWVNGREFGTPKGGAR